jgi:alkanesulfonate monooxygenase
MSRVLEVISSITNYAPSAPDAGSAALVEAAQQADAEGVDSLLVGYTATRPEGWMLAAYALAHTNSIRILLAHRPGIMSPVLAARMASTLDVMSGGRIALNIVAGGSAADQMREGDFLDHDQRYERAIEYVDVLRRAWTSPKPFDYDGKYFRAVGAFQALKPRQQGGPPIYMGGASDAATRFAVESADVYMSWSEPVDMVRERFDALRALCNQVARPLPRFSVSMRLIMAATESAAWARAEALLPADTEQRVDRRAHSQDMGRNRQLSLARESPVHDERLWMGLAAATGGQGSTGALVGTPDQVETALLRYVAEAGVDTLLLTGPEGGYEPFPPGFVPRLRRRADEILGRETQR